MSVNRTVRYRALGRSSHGPIGDSLKVDRDARLVTYDPGVVARRSVEYVARLDFELEAVAVFDNPSTAELISHVVELAAVGVGYRTYMLRPAPMWCQRLLAERHATDRDEINEALIELVALISLIESSHDASAAHGRESNRLSSD